MNSWIGYGINKFSYEPIRSLKLSNIRLNMHKPVKEKAQEMYVFSFSSRLHFDEKRKGTRVNSDSL
jgi:hypothetical protein